MAALPEAGGPGRRTEMYRAWPGARSTDPLFFGERVLPRQGRSVNLSLQAPIGRVNILSLATRCPSKRARRRVWAVRISLHRAGRKLQGRHLVALAERHDIVQDAGMPQETRE